MPLRTLSKTVQSKFFEKEIIRMLRFDDDCRIGVREGKKKKVEPKDRNNGENHKGLSEIQ